MDSETHPHPLAAERALCRAMFVRHWRDLLLPSTVGVTARQWFAASPDVALICAVLDLDVSRVRRAASQHSAHLGPVDPDPPAQWVSLRRQLLAVLPLRERWAVKDLATALGQTDPRKQAGLATNLSRLRREGLVRQVRRGHYAYVWQETA